MNCHRIKCDQCGKEAESNYEMSTPRSYFSLHAPRLGFPVGGQFGTHDSHDLCSMKCLEDFIADYKSKLAEPKKAA